ncbi:hypothetical protein [Amycolatopsis thermoflava]|uniref:hypothetical protein n=1 Tax=Amycolatopsis thermoflava TaxID=84480 RepID=UPI003F4A79D0
MSLFGPANDADHRRWQQRNLRRIIVSPPRVLRAKAGAALDLAVMIAVTLAPALFTRSLDTPVTARTRAAASCNGKISVHDAGHGKTITWGPK